MDQFPTDVFQGGAGTSVNMNTNEVIANLALELMGKEKGQYEFINPNDHVNRSQSTNCAYPTGFRISVYNSVLKLIEAIEYLKGAFELKSEEFNTVLKMGRTQLQDAVPMTVGQEFHAWAVTLNEEIRALEYTSKLLLEINLGATAIGTGLNAAQGYQALAVKHLADVTGLDVVAAEDLIEATSDCGAYVMTHGALKRLAVKLSKVCNDLRLLSSGPRAGLNELNLPELQAGSSIMPAKVNPAHPATLSLSHYAHFVIATRPGTHTYIRLGNTIVATLMRLHDSQAHSSRISITEAHDSFTRNKAQGPATRLVLFLFSTLLQLKRYFSLIFFNRSSSNLFHTC